MRFYLRHRRKIALCLLVLMVAELGLPATTYALTSGPSQPEALQFQMASTNDMVDLFTGDFKYNIPLLDIDGYPLNLNYQSGIGMDDEASWTGLGWNVNIGSINRQLRGIPDDMRGDEVQTDHHIKDKVTIGGRLSAKVEVIGKSKIYKPGGSLSLGVFNDNYMGMGAEVGANAGISVSLHNEGMLTAGMGLGIVSSTANGVNVTPSANLGIREHVSNVTLNQGVNISLGYNSRAGIKSLSLGSSFSADWPHKYKVKDKEGKEQQKDTYGAGAWTLGGSEISYNTDPIYPSVEDTLQDRVRVLQH